MKKTKKVMTNEEKSIKQNKAQALERESNLTLVSTTVAIVSFFLMMYIHNITKTNFIKAQEVLGVFEILFVFGTLACAVVAILSKKKFLWEYAFVLLVLSIGYYLLDEGVAGIPGMIKESNGTFTVSKTAASLGKIITSQNVIYALWAFNVVYCVGTIVFHSARYTKIKKGSTKL